MDMDLTDKLLSASDTGLSGDSSQAKESWKEKHLKKYLYKDSHYWKSVSWIKDPDTKHPTHRKDKYVSLKDIVQQGKEFFPGLEMIKTKEGISYALFTKAGYKPVRKTLTRFVLHLIHLFPCTLVDAMIKRRKCAKVHNQMKARIATLRNAEKS